MFDMKPDAPVEVRGEFRPIATSLPGLHICEHLPRLAQWMHKATLIRSVSHGYNSHNPYAVLTGFTGGDDRENYYTKRTDHPGISAVCQYLGIGPRDLPGSVYLPALPGYSQGLRRAGPYGGYLGRQFDPLFADCDPKFPREFDQNQSFYDPVAPYGEPRLPSFESAPALTVDRFQRRTSLLEAVDRQCTTLEHSHDLATMDHFQRKAIELLTSSHARAAFDLNSRAGGNPAPLWQIAVRHQPAGRAPAGRSRCDVRGCDDRIAGRGPLGLRTRKTSRCSRSYNLPNLDEIGSALIDRPEPARTARDDPGGDHGRNGPRSPRQRQGRPRPLATVRLRPALRRRGQRRDSSSAPATSSAPIPPSGPSHPATWSRPCTICSASTLR